MNLNTTRKERDCLIQYGIVKEETVDRLGEDGGHDPELSFDVAVAMDCNTMEDELARVRKELGHTQYVANLKVQEVASERDKLREELESARRILDDLQVACEDEIDLPELETLIVNHKRRFGGRDGE
jgi:hypothetical protein